MADEQVTQEQEANEDKRALGEGGFVEVSASTPLEKVPYELELPEEADGRVEAGFNFVVGGSLAEDAEMYGEDTVRDFWLRQAVVKAQAAIRRELQNGTPPSDIPEVLSGWRPDVQYSASRDPKTNIKSEFKKLSAEEREELLAMLAEQAEG